MKFNLLAEMDNIQQTLKNAGASDAGSTDVEGKASVQNDVSFKSMRNSINNENGDITGADVADFISKSEELNDEVDTIVFGVETDDDHIIKVYVAAEQSDEFEEALAGALGMDTDIETVLNDLANNFDIVDIVWPKGEDPASDDAISDPELDDVDAEIAAALAKDGVDDDDSFTDSDDFEVVSALPANTNKPEGSPDTPDVDDAQPLDTDATLDAEDLPPPDDNGEGEGEGEGEEVTPWMQLNDIVLAKFEDNDDIAGVEDLTYDQLASVINIEKADEIAINQYEAADFEALKADEKEDIINANADLILADKEDADSKEGTEISTGKDKPKEDKPEKSDSEDDLEEPEDTKKDKEVTESKRSFSLLASLT